MGLQNPIENLEKLFIRGIKQHLNFLMVVKNIEDTPAGLNRLFYDENVYRVSGTTGTFREIMQMGLEAIGDSGNAVAAEVIDLAEQSLALVAEDSD